MLRFVEKMIVTYWYFLMAASTTKMLMHFSLQTYSNFENEMSDSFFI